MSRCSLSVTLLQVHLEYCRQSNSRMANDKRRRESAPDGQSSVQVDVLCPLPPRCRESHVNILARRSSGNITGRYSNLRSRPCVQNGLRSKTTKREKVTYSNGWRLSLTAGRFVSSCLIEPQSAHVSSVLRTYVGMEGGVRR